MRTQHPASHPPARPGGAGANPHPPATSQKVYLIDGFLISAANVKAMKEMGLFPICYFSAGTFEKFDGADVSAAV